MKTTILIFARRDQKDKWVSHHGYVVVGVRLSNEAQRQPVIERMAAGFYGPGKTEHDRHDPPNDFRGCLGSWFGGSFDLIMELEGQLRPVSPYALFRGKFVPPYTLVIGNFQVIGDQRFTGIYEADEVLEKPCRAVQ
jgi:hypothetical protein